MRYTNLKFNYSHFFNNLLLSIFVVTHNFRFKVYSKGIGILLCLATTTPESFQIGDLPEGKVN